jgi:hypothetical protein
MNLEEYPGQDGMKVWLSTAEVDRLISYYSDDTEKRVAMSLGAKCGLRSEETIGVAP